MSAHTYIHTASEASTSQRFSSQQTSANQPGGQMSERRAIGQLKSVSQQLIWLQPSLPPTGRRVGAHDTVVQLRKNRIGRH